MSSDEDIDTMARTLWGEARNQGIIGMEAVACVIMNRLAVSESHAGYWWGNTVTDICRKPWQFSCWNENDPNREKLLAVTSDDREFSAALDIAKDAVNGHLSDVTGGANSYCTVSLKPSWAVNMIQTAIIRQHVFYKPKAY